MKGRPRRSGATLILLVAIGFLAVGAAYLVRDQDGSARAFLPSGDTYTGAGTGSAGTTGVEGELRARRSPRLTTRLSFPAFARGGVEGARLRLTPVRDSVSGLVVSEVQGDAALNECAVRPTTGSARQVATIPGPLMAGQPVEIDVTRLLSDGPLDLALTAAGGGEVVLGSRESANPPQLLVDGRRARPLLAAPRRRAPLGEPARAAPGISAGGAIQYQPRSRLARDLDGYEALGARWIRLDFAWSDVQAAGPRSHDWRRYDAVVRESRARGLRVLGVLGYTPAWARPPGSPDDDKYAPRGVASFARFAGEAARRYGPAGVHHWEIWNEPNLEVFWKPRPDPARYVALLRAAHAQIKRRDPRAVVVSGGPGPTRGDGTNIAGRAWVANLYERGAKCYFDALGFHPYTFPRSPTETRRSNVWHQMEGTNPSVRSVMIANGDADKRIWVTEFGAPTNGPSGERVSEEEQARAVVDAFRLLRAESWAGPLFWHTYRDAGTATDDRENFFGLVRPDRSDKPSAPAYRSAAR